MPDNIERKSFKNRIFIAGKDRGDDGYHERDFSLDYKSSGDFRTDRAFLANKMAEKNPDLNVLEVSSVSSSDAGKKLSAFFMRLRLPNGKLTSVESAFQSSKVFEAGGPYTDILYKKSLEAKQDDRLKSSGKLTGFKFWGHDFGLSPRTAFYDWMYHCALFQKHNADLLKEVRKYDAFTDVMFFPEKSINTQAGALARISTLMNLGLLGDKPMTFDDFVKAGLEAGFYKKVQQTMERVKAEDDIPFGDQKPETDANKKRQAPEWKHTTPVSYDDNAPGYDDDDFNSPYEENKDPDLMVHFDQDPLETTPVEKTEPVASTPMEKAPETEPAKKETAADDVDKETKPKAKSTRTTKAKSAEKPKSSTVKDLQAKEEPEQDKAPEKKLRKTRTMSR